MSTYVTLDVKTKSKHYSPSNQDLAFNYLLPRPVKKFGLLILNNYQRRRSVFSWQINNSTKDNLKHMYERTCWIFHIIIFVPSVFSSNFTSVARCSREKLSVVLKVAKFVITVIQSIRHLHQSCFEISKAKISLKMTTTKFKLWSFI